MANLISQPGIFVSRSTYFANSCPSCCFYWPCLATSMHSSLPNGFCLLLMMPAVLQVYSSVSWSLKTSFFYLLQCIDDGWGTPLLERMGYPSVRKDGVPPAGKGTPRTVGKDGGTPISRKGVPIPPAGVNRLKQESPAWMQEAYCPPCSKYLLCCSVSWQVGWGGGLYPHPIPMGEPHPVLMGGGYLHPVLTGGYLIKSQQEGTPIQSQQGGTLI